MRLGGRLAAAIDVLADMERRHRPAADALKDWGLSHRFAGSGDRSAIGNIVYDALRRRRTAAYLLDDDTPRAAAIGALVLEWGMTAKTIAASLEGDRFAPPPLSPQELKAADPARLRDAPDAIRADCPDWCVPLLKETFGDDWVNEGAALASRPPLDLRANTLLSTRDKVIAEMPDTGAAATKLAPHGVRIPPIDGAGRHPNVQAEPAFHKGWFEVQDEGSQMVAELADAASAGQVLDLCAGAGGKTLAMAAAMGNAGRIVAFDADKARLAPIFDRLRRAECRNVEVMSRRAELEALQGGMDLVLVDAPCTGSGTWRRRPDAKLRLTERQLEVRKGEQAAILDQARAYVRPGGRIVYVTCSVFRAENHERVAGFLTANPDFAAEDHAALFEARFPGKSGFARIERDRGITLSSGLSGTDGFYCAVLRRAG